MPRVLSSQCPTLTRAPGHRIIGRGEGVPPLRVEGILPSKRGLEARDTEKKTLQEVSHDT
jgi:hypothetical protein